MNLTIKTLEITAFKGIHRLELALDGKNAVISGRNGTGKTSVCDAFLWLLFGKDSAGNKPDVKPRSLVGERVEGLESDVCAVLTADGKDIELHRQWHEVWSKDAATGKKVYSRDETLCWIDGVPSKLEKEYTPYVLGLVGGDENTFKLLTDLGAFMRLPWADRRRELVKIAGGDPDAELRAMEEFNAIDDILKGLSPEDAKRRLADQRKRLETELKTLPARVDELKKTLQPVTDEEVQAARSAIDSLKAEDAEIDTRLTVSPEALKRTNDLFAQKRELETMRTRIERELRAPIEEALTTAEGKLAASRRTEASLESERLMKADECRRLDNTLAQLKDQRETKLAEWHNFDQLTYIPPEVSRTCPTCRQELPEDQVQAVYERHREEWDTARLASMEAIKTDGIKLAERIGKTTDDITAVKIMLTTLEQRLAHAPDGREELETEIARLKAAQPKPEDNEKWQAATAEIAALDTELEAQGRDEQREALKKRKAEIKAALQPHEQVLAKLELTASVTKRIDELGVQKRDIGAQVARVEGEIDLLARYVRAHCGALEESINQLFQTVRWKLFDTAKNGSLIDCCDATVNGIAYAPATLNTGACVNADIEMINILSKAYGVTAPCFIDNAERVNQIGFPGGQRILLRVTDDSELTLALEE